MRVLVTGAAGFIGSHLVERFLSDGAKVIGVDNFVTGRRENLESFQGNSQFQFLERDVIKPLAVRGALDWILHFASPASPPKYLAHPQETLRVNSEGTYHLLELARKSGAQFFLASTSEVYGDPTVHPQTESYWGNVNPTGPRSVYDEGKRYAEAITSSYARSHGVPIRIIRIFNTYGPRMDPNDGRVVTNFISQALTGQPITLYGDGLQTRSLQYVDDLVEGIVRLMGTDFQSPVNLGCPEEYTVAAIASMILELTGSHSRITYEPLPADDPRQRKPDISIARRVLGWEPQVPAREGLVRTIETMRGVTQQAVAS